MLCEYVLEGERAIINGDFFYSPVSVTFPGGITIENVTVNEDNTSISFIVPQGATEPGEITVFTNFGSTNSTFWFLDNRNIIEGFEVGRSDINGTIITDPGPGDPPSINGNYVRIQRIIGDWEWVQVFCPWGNYTNVIPDEAILRPDKYFFKFEVNTVKPYNANYIRIWITAPEVEAGDRFARWNPTLDSKGEWQTVTIPLKDIMDELPTLGVLSSGYFVGFVFCGSGRLDCDMTFDNFRIVPKD